MFLYNAGKGSTVQIFVQLGTKNAKFDTKIIDIVGQCVYAEPLYSDDKLINFSAEGLTVKMFIVNPEDEKLYQFRNFVIRAKVVKEYGVCYEILCGSAGKIANRREACRVWLGYDGTVKNELTNKEYSVLVKDISATGISFVCDNDVNIENNTKLLITFKDAAERVKFKVNAIVVRKEKNQNKNTIYGCRLNSNSNAISKYVNEKQREKMRYTIHSATKQKK